jgi:hypothetical protein
MQAAAQWVQIAFFRCRPPTVRFPPYPLFERHLPELFPRRLPDHPLHFLLEERSQNLRRVQAGLFRDTINMHWLVGLQQFVDFTL